MADETRASGADVLRALNGIKWRLTLLAVLLFVILAMLAARPEWPVRLALPRM